MKSMNVKIRTKSCLLENDLKVYKANKLIEARYNLNVIEQKLILYGASQLEDYSGSYNTILEIKTSDFMKIAGIKEESKNQKHIKKTSEELMQKQLHIEMKNGDWLLMNWLSSCEYKANQGIIEIEFSQKMIPYLVGLKEHYKTYPLGQVMQLTSKYSIRLYELLIQWEYTNHKSLKISIEELKNKLGVEHSEYERFTNFENRVIKNAITELNNKSNIYVTYEKIKTGRRISDIKFKFEIKHSEDVIKVQNLKKAGLANYIEEIKELFEDDNLKFTDLQIHEAYEFVLSKLTNINKISEFLNKAIYRYMLYYYEYTKEKAGRHSYKYYFNVLTEDYHRIKELYEFGRRPESIIYGKMD